MAWLDDFKRGFAQARADTARPLRRNDGTAAADAATPADGDNDVLAETAELAEQAEKRVAELEVELAASDVFGEVLLLPGVKRWLATRFHPDKPGLNDGERKAFTEAMQKINAAYEALEKKGGEQQ
jgi:hypothetical protein